MKTLDKDVLQYVARHIPEAIESNNYTNINDHTIEIEMFDAGNMPEGSTLKVKITIGEEK
jgi:septum formation topological specificity factor MinE